MVMEKKDNGYSRNVTVVVTGRLCNDTKNLMNNQNPGLNIKYSIIIFLFENFGEKIRVIFGEFFVKLKFFNKF